MSQNYDGDRRKKQEPINFDSRRKVPYDYKKGFSPTWQQIVVTVFSAIIIGLLSFLGANYINLNKTVADHTIQLNTIINASPVDQPQIVVNEELKSSILLLSDQVGDMTTEFSDYKREQKATDKEFEEDFEDIDDSLDIVNASLIEIKVKLGID